MFQVEHLVYRVPDYPEYAKWAPEVTRECEELRRKKEDAAERRRMSVGVTFAPVEWRGETGEGEAGSGLEPSGLRIKPDSGKMGSGARGGRRDDTTGERRALDGRG